MGQPSPSSSDVERGAVAGEGEPGHHVGDGPLVVGGGEEELGEDVGSGLGPEVASLVRVNGGGEEVPGEPVRAFQCGGRGQRVPPHGPLGVGDLLGVHGPRAPDFGAGFEGGGVGVAGGLVAGEQDRAGCVEDGGDGQAGRLAGTRRHDGHGDVLVSHADLTPDPCEAHLLLTPRPQRRA